FSDDDGVKTITIDGDNISIDGKDIKIDTDKKGEQKIIIKKESKPGKKDSKQKKETKKVIIIMKSSINPPEKQKAAFAAEPVKDQIKLPSNSSAAYLLILRQGSNWHNEKIFVRS